MSKIIVLYNLASHVSDEEFRQYVEEDKGPFLNSLPSVAKYELVRIDGSPTGDIPFKYVGIMHLSNVEDFRERDSQSDAYKAFQAKFRPMVSEIHVLSGEEIH